MAAPYGLGYGLGDMTSNLMGSYMRGQQMGLGMQQQRQGIANQDLQYQQGLMNLQERQATNNAMASAYNNATGDEDFPTNLDKASDQLAQGGYGSAALALQAKKHDIEVANAQQKAAQIGAMSNRIRLAFQGGQYQAMVDPVNALFGTDIQAAVPEDDEKGNPTGNIAFLHKSDFVTDPAKAQGRLVDDGQGNKIPDPTDPDNYSDYTVADGKSISTLGASPDHLLQAAALTQRNSDVIAQRDRKLEEDKRNHDLMNDIRQGNLKVAQERVKKMGLGSNASTAFMKNVQFQTQRLIGLGVDPKEAQSEAVNMFAPGASRDRARAEALPETAIKSELKRLTDSGAALDTSNPEYSYYMSLVDHQKGLAKKALSGLPIPLRSAPKQQQDDYIAGKPVQDPSGKVWRKQ
jgi:hypothetical protein